MVLTEVQTVPFIQKGFAHGENGKTEPCEVYFLKQKVHEIRFAATLEVNGQKFLARDKLTRAVLSQTLDSGYYFSLDSQ